MKYLRLEVGQCDWVVSQKAENAPSKVKTLPSRHNHETTSAHRPLDYNARRLRTEAVAASRHVPPPRAFPNPKPFPHEIGRASCRERVFRAV